MMNPKNDVGDSSQLVPKLVMPRLSRGDGFDAPLGGGTKSQNQSEVLPSETDVGGDACAKFTWKY
jgi:hypothetical protein